jgi:peptidoglycan/xylan/chitin deacetylase (PgdA/CDA1 family)
LIEHGGRYLPTLLYHAVGTPPAGADPGARALFVHPDRFERQMRSLVMRGFRTASLREYVAALAGHDVGNRKLLITFDDAYAHLHEVVTPILRRYHLTAVVFAPWGHLGGTNTWDAEEHPSLVSMKVATAAELQEMATGPWEVASHGMWHVDLRTLDSQLRRAQLAQAREGLSELVQRPVRELAYPYGYDDPGVRDDARAAGYLLAFADSTRKSKDPFQLPRRAISGTDGQHLFLLKTSAASELLYGMRRFARKLHRRRTLASGGHPVTLP